jgi:hypothetical protein
VFIVREEDHGAVRERYACVKHARELDLPAGTYVFEDKTYQSFKRLAAAVTGHSHFFTLMHHR